MVVYAYRKENLYLVVKKGDEMKEVVKWYFFLVGLLYFLYGGKLFFVNFGLIE